jgi:hypothetical protein
LVIDEATTGSEPSDFETGSDPPDFETGSELELETSSELKNKNGFISVFVQGGSPTPHPFSSRPHFVCKFSRQRSTEVF